MRYELDLHVHTRASGDSFSSPRAIVKAATRSRLDGLAITDHDTIQGALKVRRAVGSAGLIVIVGEEVATDLGDIIGLFLEREVRTRDPFDAIDQIHSQGGLAVLPHPFKGHRRVEELAAAVDLVEAFNSRASDRMNEDAERLALSHSKACVGGSDSHMVSEIGNCRTVVHGDDIRTAVSRGASDVSWRPTRPGTEAMSQTLASLRTGRFHRTPFHLGKAVLDRLDSEGREERMRTRHLGPG